MNIKFRLIDTSLPMPEVSYIGDAGFDLYAREKIILSPGEWKAIPTGMSFEIPTGFVGLIWDKSGLSTKFALKTLGGVIDSGYRGEVMVGIINLGKEVYTFEKGNKVAQMLIQKIEHPTFEQTDMLSDSSRGENGFGSAGE